MKLHESIAIHHNAEYMIEVDIEVNPMFVRVFNWSGNIY